MKMARGLGATMLALALVGTACGSKQADTPSAIEIAPEQVVLAPPNGQANAPKTKDGHSSDAQQHEPGKTDPNKSVSNQPAPQAQAQVQNAGKVSQPASGKGHASPSKPATTPAPLQPVGKYDLYVTQNFGQAEMYNQSVGYAKNQFLLDSMRDHLQVETAYGGGFVNGINGVKSGYTDKSIFTRKKRDWFYYVNGSISAVGADAYQLGTSDAVWWDYHDWSGSGSNTPCIVGSYPHPFTVGYNGMQPGTVIYYSGDHASDADRLAKALQGQGAKHVRTAKYDDSKILGSSTNAIVLGTWSELGEQAAIDSLFGSPTRTGLYASFAEGVVTALDYTGDEVETTGSSVILATGSGNGDTSPLWLVIGTKEATLDQAIDTLISSPGKLNGNVGVMLNGTQVIGVPVTE